MLNVVLGGKWVKIILNLPTVTCAVLICVRLCRVGVMCVDLCTIRQTVIVAVLVLWVCAKLIFLQIAQSVAIFVLLITIVCSFDI